MKKMNYFFIGILFLLLFSSCKRGGNDDKQRLVISGKMADSNINNALGYIYYMFPSPLEILTAIKHGGLVYEPGLLNSVEKREKYVKSDEQYLNLGIYLTDLSYCVLFARNNDSKAYLETIKRISDNVNLSSKISNEFIEKMKNKINSVDSLVIITDEFFSK